MKKLIFISLLVIPFCKAADPCEKWHQVIQEMYTIPELETFNLSEQEITQIQKTFDLQEQEILDLQDRDIDAIPHDLKLPKLLYLSLDNNKITALPGLYLPKLRALDLDNNKIGYIAPEILQQFPELRVLNVSNNPLTKENVDQLREARPDLEINADGIYGTLNIKPGKR